MPRDYFDMREGDDIAPDEEGLELPTIGSSEAKQPIPSPIWQGMRSGAAPPTQRGT